MKQFRLGLFASMTVLVLCAVCPDAAPGQSRVSVHQTTLEEPNQKTPEVSTEELIKILENKSDPVLDVAEEIAMKAYWKSSYFGDSFEKLKRWRQ